MADGVVLVVAQALVEFLVQGGFDDHPIAPRLGALRQPRL